ncbi:remorin 1.4-like [Corylus avellana]|uniref:remorin 1.4-like n=1 Tax=Corylus avellana TaxID=13451 RepID=UPI00286A545C|nr:remorin 1.4-like [Corylus avellana]XP_059448640.1 remorin 1.4-like [Corylus avellana]
MDALLKQMRTKYSGPRREKTQEAGSLTDRRIPPQKTQSFKEKKNWLQRQFSGRKSQDYDSSNGVDPYAATVAAAAFAINALDEPGTPLTTIKSKKEGKAILIEEDGRASKRLPGETSMKYSEREDRKVPATAAMTGKPIGRVPSMKKTPTFADHLKSTDSIRPEADVPATLKPVEIQRQSSTRTGIPPSGSRRQSSMRSATQETEADAWEEAELAKIKDRHEKLISTLNSWEEKKRNKASRKLKRTESELERRRKKAMDEFRRDMEYIEQIAVGAREKAKDNRRVEELKVKEKSTIIRTTGRVPKTCFCC